MNTRYQIAVTPIADASEYPMVVEAEVRSKKLEAISAARKLLSKYTNLARPNLVVTVFDIVTKKFVFRQTVDNLCAGCLHPESMHTEDGCRSSDCGCGRSDAQICPHCGRLFDPSNYKLSSCFSCDFWGGYAAKYTQPNQVVVDGEHYVIASEQGGTGSRGFGGRHFRVKFHDGRIVDTTNLWHQGTIPSFWLPSMPDNAEFVQEGPW